MRSGPLAIGQDFGPRYHVVKLLGSGGMGVVYQALDRELGEDIALKVLRAPARLAAAGSLAEMQRRFRAELVLARKVTHKHVIRIHDIGEIDGIKFISMPLVKGRDLSAILANGPLPVERALRYARQIVSGLTAVHAAGVVHRDMKPSNIMIGSDDQVLLMDFGIARANAPAGQQRTIAGAVVGTTAYMAPEQARGDAVDQRTDVYSFGLVLYEMLCGIRDDLTIAELLARMKAAPPSARQRNPAVPADLDAIVMRCLKPSAGDRYQTSAEVAAALSGFNRSKRRAIPAFAWPQWAPRAAAAAVAIALLAGLGYWLTTPSASKALARGGAVLSQSLDRLSELNPATLLASEPAAPPGVEPDEVHAGQKATTTAPGDSTPRRGEAAVRDRAEAAVRRDDRMSGVPRAAYVQLPQPEAVAARVSSPKLSPAATLRPHFDEVRRPDLALPTRGQLASPRRYDVSVASPVRTLAPWNTDHRPAPSPFAAPIPPAPSAASAASPIAARDENPASVQLLRAAADASTGGLERVLSSTSYVKTARYTDPFEEFQVCHVPTGATVQGAEVR